MEIEVDHLTKIWRDSRADITALDGITHRFRSARFASILGPSGCGKSTLIQIIGGLEPASSGSVRVIDPNNPTAAPARLGAHSVMVWQTLNLFPWRTVIDNVAFGLEMQGVPKRERRERAAHWIASVGLRRFAEHYPRQLSGGMRQRVALARALIMERPIMLMDEPFAALDAQTKIVMQEELARIFESTQKTILFVTHAIDEAILLGDEVIVMTARPGRIKEVIAVDLPRPRSQDLVNTIEFGRLYDRALHLIREEVINAMRQEEAEG
jgi:NitT/TauT family transport system ATP-binding protein